MKISLTLQGDKELLRTLAALEQAVTDQLQIDALMAGFEPMRAHAAALAPRSKKSTPHMADDIAIVPASQRRQENLQRDDVLVEMGPLKKPHDHFYGFFVEYGTLRHRAQPFMRPAFDATADQCLMIALNHLWAAVEAVARTTAKTS